MAPTYAAGMAQLPTAEMYPHIEWETSFRKMADMLNQPQDWSADIPKITSPTLLIFADADSLLLEHIMAFYVLLGGGTGGWVEPIHQPAGDHSRGITLRSAIETACGHDRQGISKSQTPFCQCVANIDGSGLTDFRVRWYSLGIRSYS